MIHREITGDYTAWVWVMSYALGGALSLLYRSSRDDSLTRAVYVFFGLYLGLIVVFAMRLREYLGIESIYLFFTAIVTPLGIAGMFILFLIVRQRS